MNMITLDTTIRELIASLGDEVKDGKWYRVTGYFLKRPDGTGNTEILVQEIGVVKAFDSIREPKRG